MKQIYIYGCSGHGLVVADIAKACGYKTIIFIDDAKNENLTFEEIKKDNAFPIALGVGDNIARKKIFEKVQAHGFKIATLVHPSSIISSDAHIEEGTIVMPNVVVNTYAHIGRGVILNTSCVVEHECTIEDFAHLSPNVALGGNVKVGQLTHIGIGTSIIQGIRIGANAIIGAGSVVVDCIEDEKVCFGNPCRVMRDNQHV